MKIKVFYCLTWISVRIITKLFFRIRVIGSANIPRNGGFILGCNHISNLDPPFIASWARREVYFVAKAELFRGRFSSWLFPRLNAFPIRRGTFDKVALETAVKHLESGVGVIMFPEGTRSRTDEFLPPKPGIGIVALRSKVPVIPVYLAGTNKLSECLLFRRRMLIMFGDPVMPEEYSDNPENKQGYLELANQVMSRIASLRDSVE